MNKKQLKHTTFFAVIWVLMGLSLLGGATYAWFTFSNNTRTTDLSAHMTEGETETIEEVIQEQLPDELKLLISNNYNGPYDTTCNLIISGGTSDIEPISTCDLTSFYQTVAENTNGLAVIFDDVTSSVYEKSFHGYVYLKMEQQSGAVYLDTSNMTFTGDMQALASLRLGLKITTPSTAKTLICNLDAMGNTAGASEHQTIAQSGAVISGSDADGTYYTVADPAVSITFYNAGGTPICAMADGDIATIEYYLYLEGCDDNCYDVVEGRPVGLTLAFTAG